MSAADGSAANKFIQLTGEGKFSRAEDRSDFVPASTTAEEFLINLLARDLVFGKTPLLEKDVNKIGISNKAHFNGQNSVWVCFVWPPNNAMF